MVVFLLYIILNKNYLRFKEPFNTSIIIMYSNIFYMRIHSTSFSGFEKLYNTCYKSSGISVSTYNTLIDGGTVIATPHTESRILHKTLYSPNKILQIISGKFIKHFYLIAFMSEENTMLIV